MNRKNRRGEVRQRTLVAKSTLLKLSLALSLTAVPAAPHARGEMDDGRYLVETICAECHAVGKDGAPKLGDQEAWRVRASQGLSSLTRHALDGIRNMPAHGGRPDLSDLQIARAITHMVNLSGGNWVEPASAEELMADRSGEQVVREQCIKCHAEGINGAPKIGDRDAWVERIMKQQGLDHLVRSAIRGHGGMPPRGDRADLTDAEINAAILYMFNPSGIPATPILAVASPATDKDTLPSHMSGGEIDIYLGLVSAQSMLNLPADHPERTMHGGVPRGGDHYHLNVSLFNMEARTPISDAQVIVQISRPGAAIASTRLEPMLVGVGSYGNYIELKPRMTHRMSIQITRPETDRAVEALFEYRPQ